MSEKLKVLDLFSGIGGFSLGLERTGGFETVAFCEIEPFPRKVLAKHWPEVPCYEDVTKLTGDILRRDGISVDVITGGFPCQDISAAGRQAGIGEGTRSGLWSEIVRIIGELSPRFVIVENVANLLSGPSEQRGGWFGRILGDLAECGYDAEWENIPAAAVGAPHRRERVWVVAYPAKEGVYGQRQSHLAGEESVQRRGVFRDGVSIWGLCEKKDMGCALRPPLAWAPKGGGVEPSVARVVDGVPFRMDRIGSLGNAVVPQIPELIGRAIMEATQ